MVQGICSRCGEDENGLDEFNICGSCQYDEDYEEGDLVELPCGHHVDTFAWEGWCVVCDWQPAPDENFTVKPVSTDNIILSERKGGVD